MSFIDPSTLPEQLFMDDPNDYDILLDEAVNRMEALNMSDLAINALRRGEVWMSEGIGALYNIPEDDYGYEVINLIREKGLFPYHLIHSYTNIGELFSVLVVSNYPEEWEMDHDELANGYALADVYNRDMGGLDDLGTIGIRPSIGGLIRTA